MRVRLKGSLATAIAGPVETESVISHYDLDRLIADAGLSATDPKRLSQSVVGKHKRISPAMRSSSVTLKGGCSPGVHKGHLCYFPEKL
jgi:hypothetical protein